MELLYKDDPRRIGPFPTVGLLGDAASRRHGRERRFVAHSASGDRTLIVTTLSQEAQTDTACLTRFRFEAEQAQRLSTEIPGLVPVIEISSVDDGQPWYASPFVPALSLPDVMGAYGGPLPLRTVVTVGAVLAETLTSLHERGFAHAGITPWSALLSAEGPRLASYGAVRSAAPDGEDRSGLPGLVSESVPPEQLTGGRPRPLGDIYSLGVVLSYAATGHMIAESEELPVSLQSLIAACLARDPARRPPASTVLDELMRSSGQWAENVHGNRPSTATVLDGDASRAGSLLSPGWIPKRVCVALGAQAEQVLAAETDPQLLALHRAAGADFESVTVAGTHGPTGSARVSVGEGHESGVTATSETATPPPSRTSRRKLVTTAASGAAGIAIGGTVTWMVTSEEVPSPTLAQRLAAKKTPRRRPQGAPPTPRWRFEVPGDAPKYAPVTHSSEIAVVVNGSAVHGVELRSGKQVWQSRIRASGQPRMVEGGSVLIPAGDMIALNARTGAVRWRSKKFRKGGASPYVSVLAVDGSTAWFTIKEPAGDAPGSGWTVVAYDVAESSELWRRPVPAGTTGGHLSKDLLVVTASKNSSSAGKEVRSAALVAFDRRTGDVRWRRDHAGPVAGSMMATFGDGRLVTAEGPVLRGYAMEKGDKPQWRLETGGEEGQRPQFGPPLVHGESAFITDVSQAVHAVDAEGRVKWRSPLDRAWTATERPPDTLINSSGQLVLSLDEAEVIARDARNGSVLWRFLDTPRRTGGPTGWRRAAATDDLAVVVSRNSVYALPLD
ncbi:PQQ-binding-like beta-propeller repeat protein [Streptomyces albidus (ex Kaewkla and Franco 2022)]|uniref:outer membrane protein assembly factor BamB family protein n=1 Tax=Streptomyces albidus (ex Kaewkla and Franco 2022) TaxID=722709 RepID=UPI0015EF8A41|nr:PQQ-binding-like beta-propeller repeat protein [Streptomyces albidus (ex Kaewkla and Franco 2022)]